MRISLIEDAKFTEQSTVSQMKIEHAVQMQKLD